MNKEHTEYLVKHFPWIEPTDGYGIGVGDGWFDLLVTLCENIDSAIKFENSCIMNYNSKSDEEKKEWIWTPNDKPFEFPIVDQIKEKFGGLRFYARTPSGTRYEFRGMIQMAEAMSFRICEDCGNKGEMRDGSWKRTLCNLCHMNRQTKRKVVNIG